MPTAKSGHASRQLYLRVDAGVAAAEDVALLASCASLFAVMLVKAVDVTLRYFFNHPLQWSYGLISHYLLVAAFFLAMPYTFRMGGHVNVDIVVRHLPERLVAVCRVLTLLLSLLLFAGITYEGWRLTADAWTGTQIMTDFYNIPSWTSKMLVPIGIVLLELRIALKLTAHIFRLPDEPRLWPFFLPSE